MSLVVRGLRVSYGHVEVVKGIDLELRPGVVTTIIGANGAGKTTIMKSIAGLLPQARGSVVFQGVELLGRRAHEIVGQGVALVPEGRRLFASMTVQENLMIGAYRRPDDEGVRADFDRILDYLPVLRERLGQSAGSLSGGQQQMLAIGRALMGRPHLLMLDEPSLGLAPIVIEQVFDKILELNKRTRLGVLLVEQNSAMALEIASRAFVLETGAITLSGPSAELANDPRIREAYLGG
jgi:branched-chain amino acid transport system ATP-binding protein